MGDEVLLEGLPGPGAGLGLDADGLPFNEDGFSFPFGVGPILGDIGVEEFSFKAGVKTELGELLSRLGELGTKSLGEFSFKTGLELGEASTTELGEFSFKAGLGELLSEESELGEFSSRTGLGLW